jgi:hypothetical protein
MTEPNAHSIYDVLKDFQPTLAALIALTAACIAYIGVTAKVRADKEIVENELARKTLGLYLKLAYELHGVAGLCRGITANAQSFHEQLSSW